MASSDIIKIGFDYRSSLEQFEKDTNGVFDGISDKAGKQKITIQLDAKDDKVIDKIKELQKLKLDKFTFEFGDSGLKEQLQTFGKLENKINEIINLSKRIDLSFDTKNKTEAYNQLKKYADAFKNYYGNEEVMATNAGAKAGYAYYKAYEEALRKGVAQSKLEKVTIDFDVNSSIHTKEDVVERRIEEFKKFQKYGDTDESTLIGEIAILENRLLKFNSAYSQVKANLGDAPITPEITKNIEEYVRLLEVAESRAKDAELFGYSSEDINSDKDLANMYLDSAKKNATVENKKYIESLKQEETQAVATAEGEQKLAEAQKETVSNTSNSNNSQIEELKSDIQEVKTELGDAKDRISSIESNGFENVREDVEKTKESVKELNSELTEMKSNLSSTPQDSNFSSKNIDKVNSELSQEEKKIKDIISLFSDMINISKKGTNGTLFGETGKAFNLSNMSKTDDFLSDFRGALNIIDDEYDKLLSEISKKLLDTFVHTHPNGVASFSPNDISSAFALYNDTNNAITKQIIVTENEISFLDIAKVKNALNSVDLENKFVEEFEKAANVAADSLNGKELQYKIKEILINLLDKYGIDSDTVYKSASLSDFAKAYANNNINELPSARKSVSDFNSVLNSYNWIENVAKEDLNGISNLINEYEKIKSSISSLLTQWRDGVLTDTEEID